MFGSARAGELRALVIGSEARSEAYEDHDGVELDGPETACHDAQQVAWKPWQDPPVGNKGPVTSVLDSAGHLITRSPSRIRTRPSIEHREASRTRQGTSRPASLFSLFLFRFFD
jgi:hypothetical protein